MRTKKQVQQDSARSLMIKKIIESEHSKEVHVDGLKEKTIEDMAYGNRDVHRDAPFDPNDMDLIFSKWER